ncbi:sigma-70 family RNA polymerase sigma factor [Desmospora profundinema]|uniref:RNA polymerase sigma factor (Sigma-70 family) n=1 Tax=Desmospora profundinema TaxID=1571184 RepID=A0ABU1ILE0_9BACL|nr:sigma-70 family RNA polymerase sigma factor [Desmospora profundinema]MDR6225596.1 RNA polymerase sigma factor (sigma-70 family) [Desmospora profundinema]
MRGWAYLQEEPREADDFEYMFKTYYPFVVHQVMRVIPSQSVAEDIAQEVFLHFYDTDRARIEKVSAWLTRTALNTAYNYLRSEKRHRNRMEKETRNQSHCLPSTETKWLEQEEIVSVRHILLQMNERERNLLLMKYSGFSYQELSHALEIKAESVGTLLARAKNKFRKLYQRVREDAG